MPLRPWPFANYNLKTINISNSEKELRQQKTIESTHAVVRHIDNTTLIMTITRTKLHKIAMGGGCHWCTEAIYQALRGVVRVEQGFVASVGADSDFSEAVIVHYQTDQIDLNTLIKVHLLTHQSTSDHSMRHKYRSAIYTFSKAQYRKAQDLLAELKAIWGKPLSPRYIPSGVSSLQ